MGDTGEVAIVPTNYTEMISLIHSCMPVFFDSLTTTKYLQWAGLGGIDPGNSLLHPRPCHPRPLLSSLSF